MNVAIGYTLPRVVDTVAPVEMISVYTLSKPRASSDLLPLSLSRTFYLRWPIVRRYLFAHALLHPAGKPFIARDIVGFVTSRVVNMVFFSGFSF